MRYDVRVRSDGFWTSRVVELADSPEQAARQFALRHAEPLSAFESSAAEVEVSRNGERWVFAVAVTLTIDVAPQG